MRFCQMHVAGWTVRLWDDPQAQPLGQDAHCVQALPGGLRLAAIDGASPAALCENPLAEVGVDGAVWAAYVVRFCLMQDQDIPAALARANDALHIAGAAPTPHGQRVASVCAADITPTGQVRAWQAGDCIAWARTAQGWHQLGATALNTPEVQDHIDGWLDAHPEATRAQVLHWLRTDPRLGDPEGWLLTPVGTFPECRVLELDVPADWDALVLSSDGAALDADACAHLPEYLASLRARERERARASGPRKVHDDVTVLQLTRHE